MELDEIYEDTWKSRENEWLPDVKNDVLSTAFYYARYILGMEDLTGFSMKDSLPLPSLAYKYFICLRDENRELFHTFTEPCMRKFVGQSIKGCRCAALDQHYKSEISDEVCNFMSQEIGVNGNICEILEKYFEF